MTRRIFAKFAVAAVGAAIAPDIAAQSSTTASADDGLKSEFLLDLVIETQPANMVGSVGGNRIVVPVSGGTFDGPRLKGTIVGPSGDWIVGRPDGSSVLDVRLVLQTDDAQKIYVTWRGISYTPQAGPQYARILPLFETGAANYLWLNSLVAVGVYRPTLGKVAYRVYRIL